MRFTAYVLGLILIFGAAAGAGKLLGTAPRPAPAHTAGAHSGHETTLPAGLQVTQQGYTLSPLTSSFAAGEAQPFAFRILGPDGRAVTRFAGDLHLIVVRRDLADYQHLHPVRAADGTWSTTLTVPEPGQYRVFTDFTPLAVARNLVLGTDIPAAGDYRPRPLPASGWAVETDGYTVTRAGDPQAGAPAWVTMSVSRDGQPVTLEPYLGTFGHVVALRQGDLAYLHMHPQDGSTAGSDVTVDATVPSGGVYRLFLEFRHGGTVHLAEFTADATTGGHRHD
ncbi:hypothetical protein ACWT_5468 [Actinoplanes sp. SE50]|nr:hypothetical protein ACPL_5598 [Actinoplanes sp. SE50/110]ATO84883.1 hypothetical protein ACWT_5468 [Actinoplanes sp. SE50]SLM02292.1 hypothetical protein ACSP50_5531 [Actinoplanes sp. SE50/110]